MEEHIGKRINHERVDEALATGATTVATACPFCRVMVTDGVNDRQEAAGREGVDVRDVAQLLLESLDRTTITLPEKGAAAKQAAEHAEKAAPKTAGGACPGRDRAGRGNRRSRSRRAPRGEGHQSRHRTGYRRRRQAARGQEGSAES